MLWYGLSLRYRPICALLNQFCSLLSRSTSVSLRLNSSGLLLSLETFNSKDISIFYSFWVKKMLYLVIRYKKVSCLWPQFFCFFFFIFWHTLIPISWWKPSNRQEFFLNLFFLFVYELSGCGFESRCSHLSLKYCACFKQGVPWHSSNYRVWIHFETHTWHVKNKQS